MELRDFSVRCLSCASLRGEITLSPGGVVYKGKYWQVEHAYPVAIKGWFVIILRRHTAALHDLLPAEWNELSRIQRALVSALREIMHCEKEYIACFAEQRGFRHIHWHIIARPRSLPLAVRGLRVFSLIKIDKGEAVPAHDIEAVCEQLRRHLQKRFKARFE